MVADEVVAQPVELAGGDARFDTGCDEIESFGRQPAGPAHAVEIGCIVQLHQRAGATRLVVKELCSHRTGG